MTNAQNGVKKTIFQKYMQKVNEEIGKKLNQGQS
jgi:hypothetical protein